MTCAMDWVYLSDNPTFDDVWVARGMNCDTYFDIPADGSWDSAWNLFWNNAKARERLKAHEPFQVFSCWNGASAISAKPLLEAKVKFRGPVENECFQGEPKLFTKDMWFAGFGKMAVVPSVSLEYWDENAKRLKELKGYTSNWVGDGTDEPSSKIEWESNPPDKVKCIPHGYDKQIWIPWNESLPLES